MKMQMHGTTHGTTRRNPQSSVSVQSKYSNTNQYRHQQGSTHSFVNLTTRKHADTPNQIPAALPEKTKMRLKDLNTGFTIDTNSPTQHLQTLKPTYAAIVKGNRPPNNSDSSLQRKELSAEAPEYWDTGMPLQPANSGKPNMNGCSWEALSIPSRETDWKDEVTQPTQKLQVKFGRWIGLGRGRRKSIETTEVGRKIEHQSEAFMQIPSINSGSELTKPTKNILKPWGRARGIRIAKNTETTVVGRITANQSEALKTTVSDQPGKTKNKIHAVKSTHKNSVSCKKYSQDKTIKSALDKLSEALNLIHESKKDHHPAMLERIFNLLRLTKKNIEDNGEDPNNNKRYEIFAADYSTLKSSVSGSLDEKIKHHNQTISQATSLKGKPLATPTEEALD